MNHLTSEASALPTMQAAHGSANPTMQSAPQQGPQPPQALALTLQQIRRSAELATYATQEFGTLAKKPDLTPEDVVNSAGQAVADGKITAGGAVKLLAWMPPDETQLRPWVDQLYMNSIITVVHLKVALMRQGMTQ